MARMTRITTYDSTLRDGEQAEGVILSLEDKLRIAHRLDSFGIDIIEGGFPSSNPKDMAFFQEMRKHPLRHARLAAFGATCRKDMQAHEDPGLARLLESGAPVIALVGKTWDEQVTHILQTSLDENLRMIRDSIAFLKAYGRELVFDAEHFFDGYKANPDYALACVRVALIEGADSIDLCDTNGGALPFEIEEAVQAVFSSMRMAARKPRIGIHCHNDAGCGVANTLAAVRAGARQVQGTVNGYGERVGNADLLTIIANLELKMDLKCVGPAKLRELTSVAEYVADICNLSLSAHAPYVGSSAFAHKAGLHASAISRYPEAYNHTNPELVGNINRLLVSELAGRASLIAKADALGFDLTAQAEVLHQVLDEIKCREACGYSYEVADGSLALLIRSFLGESEPHFTLESFRVIVDAREGGQLALTSNLAEHTEARTLAGALAKDAEPRSLAGALAREALSEATIKIHVGEERYVATGEGVGPVGALASALKLALRTSYPQVLDMHLIDFKVRLLDESTGTDAITRVTITTRDEAGVWGTIGVSENIIEASWNALVESIEYGLVRMGA